MRAVLIGDVGRGYHMGDEAMLEVAVSELRQRADVELTVVSSDPSDTASRYGVRSIDRIGISGESAASEQYGDQPLGDQERRRADVVASAIEAADALIITGGGNLTSSWPDRIFERVAALSIAHRAGVPAIVTSQTIGPDLTDRQAVVLGEALSQAKLVGLRETASYRLASGILGPTTPRRLQLDDAAALPDGEPALLTTGERLAAGFVVLSCNAIGTAIEGSAYLAGLATLVRRLNTRTALPVLFLPNVAPSEDDPTGDTAVGEAIARDVGNDAEFVLAPLLPAREVAALCRRAVAVVSTRYHPIVFGLSGAVPCFALTQDRYTTSKLRGALAHAGLSRWTLPIEALLTEVAEEAIDELWARHDELTTHLGSATEAWPEHHRAHWDEVWQVLTGGGAATPVIRPFNSAPEDVSPKVGGLAALNAVSAEHLEQAARTERRLRSAFVDAETYALDLKATLDARDSELDALRAHLTSVQADLNLQRAAVEAENIQLLDETRIAELSSSSARAMLAELREDHEVATTELTEATSRASGLADHLDALYATKMLRWSRFFRTVYAKLRRRPRPR